MPGKTDLSQLNCSLARTLEVIGDWWTMLIVRDAFLGSSRFGEFQQTLGIAKNILSVRLDRLVSHGIFERSGSDRRPRYRLTERGRALLPALVALMQWGDQWLSDNRPPILVMDAHGSVVAPLELRSVNGILDPGAVEFQPGSGATPQTRAFLAATAARLLRMESG